ncbi:MAG: hypothetical protein LW715_11700 [Rhodobacter sp.]|jgi:hypothetical protein|nr:hypothetical protein [Rhodobacter sp.]
MAAPGRDAPTPETLVHTVALWSDARLAVLSDALRAFALPTHSRKGQRRTVVIGPVGSPSAGQAASVGRGQP